MFTSWPAYLLSFCCLLHSLALPFLPNIHRNILIPFPMNCELVFMDIHSIIAKQQTFVFAVFCGLISSYMLRRYMLCLLDSQTTFSCVLSFLVMSSSQYRICVHSINGEEEKILPLVLDLRPL